MSRRDARAGGGAAAAALAARSRTWPSSCDQQGAHQHGTIPASIRCRQPRSSTPPRRAVGARPSASPPSPQRQLGFQVIDQRCASISARVRSCERIANIGRGGQSFEIFTFQRIE